MTRDLDLTMGEIDYLSFGFAAVVLGGGLVGFIKAGELVGFNWEAVLITHPSNRTPH